MIWSEDHFPQYLEAVQGAAVGDVFRVDRGGEREHRDAAAEPAHGVVAARDRRVQQRAVGVRLDSTIHDPSSTAAALEVRERECCARVVLKCVAMMVVVSLLLLRECRWRRTEVKRVRGGKGYGYGRRSRRASGGGR